MVRAVFAVVAVLSRLAALAVVFAAGLALADVAGPPAPDVAPAPSLLGQLIAQLLPPVASALGLVLTAFVAVPLKKWLTAKATTSELANVALKVEHLAEGVVADLNATLVDEIRKALADDGRISKEEATKIRTIAIERLKGQLGAQGLEQLGGILGLGGEALERYLAGMIEKKVEAAKAAGEAAAAAVPDPKAAAAVISAL